MDIKRICQDPTAEDRKWFPHMAGGDWLKTLKFAAESFKDESAILQFLSPKLIRHFRLFAILDDDRRREVEVTAIHDEDGYRHVRKALSAQHDIGNEEPNIVLGKVDWSGDRKLTLVHRVANRRLLHGSGAKSVLHHVEQLWGFPVDMEVESAAKTERVWGVSNGEVVFDIDNAEGI